MRQGFPEVHGNGNGKKTKNRYTARGRPGLDVGMVL